MGLWKGKLKKETECLLIAAQNDVIKINYIKMKINTQQNSNCRLCGDRGEIVNHIRKCNKLVQKEYKTRQSWRGKGDLLGTVQEIKIWPY